MPPFSLIGERVLLTLWVGGMWTSGYVAAPMLFSVLDDRQLAGTLAGQLFAVMSYIGLACGTLLLLGAALRAGRKWANSAYVWTLLVMLTVIVVGQFLVAPRIAELRASGLLEGTEVATQFARMHGLASVLFLINSLLGLGLVAYGGSGRGGSSGA